MGVEYINNNSNKSLEDLSNNSFQINQMEQHKNQNNDEAKNEEEQQLVVVERVSSQRYQRTVLEEVFFVPLQSGIV